MIVAGVADGSAIVNAATIAREHLVAAANLRCRIVFDAAAAFVALRGEALVPTDAEGAASLAAAKADRAAIAETAIELFGAYRIGTATVFGGNGASEIAAADGSIDAAFIGGVTPMFPWTADLFDRAVTIATGVVAAFESGFATIGSALLQSRRADACAIAPDLPAGAGDRFRSRSRSRTAGCLGPVIQQGTRREGGPADAEESFQDRPPVGAARQRFDKRIEPSIVHVPSPHRRCSTQTS